MIWQTRRRQLDLSRRGLVMGVINVTPDSFSDGGKFFASESAVAHGLELVGEGAEILDIGGESTRPGAEPVAAGEQIRRVVPVIETLRSRSEVLISIDTTSAEVAAAAIAAGADIINDVSGLRGVGMARVAAESGAGVVIMHMQGEPRNMQMNPVYTDVVREVREFFSERLEAALAAGMAREAIAFDPGIGFGKTLAHNLELLRCLDQLSPAPDRPIVIGVSRKSFIGGVIGSADLADRHWPTVALSSLAREKGARIIRVHEVLPNVQAVRMTEAILEAGE